MTFSTVGFIGLGTMGYPMCENLIQKLPSSTRFFVYDVSQPSVDRLRTAHGQRVSPCASSKGVADNAVCMTSHPKHLSTSN